ncbi:MAG: hypothetical protein AAF215_25125 [Cyanobacteria bacterium P01_A01_bin.123]
MTQCLSTYREKIIRTETVSSDAPKICLSKALAAKSQTLITAADEDNARADQQRRVNGHITLLIVRPGT